MCIHGTLLQRYVFCYWTKSTVPLCKSKDDYNGSHKNRKTRLNLGESSSGIFSHFPDCINAILTGIIVTKSILISPPFPNSPSETVPCVQVWKFKIIVTLNRWLSLTGSHHFKIRALLDFHIKGKSPMTMQGCVEFINLLECVFGTTTRGEHLPVTEFTILLESPLFCVTWLKSQPLSYALFSSPP